MDRDERQGHGTRIAAQRHTQIIAATMRLITRDGAATLSTRKVARAADVDLATLHYAFGGKIERSVKGMDTDCDRGTHVDNRIAPRVRRKR